MNAPRAVAAIALATLLAACSESAPPLIAVPVPDSKAMVPGVAKHLAAARAEFDRIAATKPGNATLAQAYGALGLVYHAQDLPSAAQAAYENAHALAPKDKRWPYLLGHLHADASQVPEARDAFEAVLAIDANDVPAQVYLAQVYLLQGELDKSRVLFAKAMANPDAKAAALTGLGKVALARKDYPEAARDLEQALALAPGAARLFNPLAMAYRGMGDSAKAEVTLKQFSTSGLEPGFPDPVVDILADQVVAPHVLISRGKRAARTGRFDLAERAFRRAVEFDPTNADAAANLGISLANLGRTEEAQKRLEEATTLGGSDAMAQFSLGVVYDRQGRDADAMRLYESAIHSDPRLQQAIAYLADAKLRTGQGAEAAALYESALAGAPGSSRFLFSHAMASIRAGHNVPARKSLEAALARDAENPVVANALVRVLSAAPEAAARDGARAVRVGKFLYETTQHNMDVAQSYAMALAETGNYEEAVKMQQQVLEQFSQAGVTFALPLLERNLALYRARKPTREGWSFDDPLFKPRSGAVQVTKKAS